MLFTVFTFSRVAEWTARRTRNSAVPGPCPALATCWICSRLSGVQNLGHTYTQCLRLLRQSHKIVPFCIVDIYISPRLPLCTSTPSLKCFLYYKQH